MTIFNLCCNHCGAPLQVPEKTRYLTCRFCSSQLEVRQSDNAAYTEVLQAIDQRTVEMAKDLDTIKRQNELQELDREWQREREQFLVRGKYGRTSVPNGPGSLIGMAIGVVFGLLWTAIAFSLPAPAPIPFIFGTFGMMFILVVVIGSVANFNKALNYRVLEAEYVRRRQELQRGEGAP